MINECRFTYGVLLCSLSPSKPGWVDRPASHMSPESTYGWWWWSEEGRMDRTALGKLIIAIMRYEQRKAISPFSRRSSACNFECFWNDGAAVNLIWLCKSQWSRDERWTSKADQKLQLILTSPGENCDSKSTSHLENNNVVKEWFVADFPIRN